jgi:uncharacterized protein YbbC (DUF1343 family)/CubicO group peptidase (beta-lactamase class C family)
MILLLKRKRNSLPDERRSQRVAHSILLQGFRPSQVFATLLTVVLLSSLLPVSQFAQRKVKSSLNAPQRLAVALPEAAGMDGKRLARIEEAVNDSIKRKETPGAVVLVGRKGKIVYRKAFGNRALEPQTEAMTVDTIFDMASLTKVVATATSMMILVEQGKVRLGDPVIRYIPEFGQAGKDRITVEQLLTHRAGFVPDNSIHDYEDGAEKAMQRIYDLKPDYEPGTRFVYSDVGYIVAAEIIKRVTGKRIDEFARENIFPQLGMRDTRFLSSDVHFWNPESQAKPEESARPIVKEVSGMSYEGRAGTLRPFASNSIFQSLNRVAPTERREGRKGDQKAFMRGEVHDPRAYLLGGVAGHAGLFSTADDLAIFCQMILNGGSYNGVRILSPYAVERMTMPRGVPVNELRGIGWDVGSSYSTNRGDLFPIGTFGHTGFTGTSIWIDPTSQTFVIILTNRVHPNGKGDVANLRSFIASIVAGSIVAPPYAPLFEAIANTAYYDDAPRIVVTKAAPPETIRPVLTGIDVLERDNFKALEGRNIGLITNHTGRDRAGRSTIDVFAAQKNLKLVALFSPEHGLRGLEDNSIANSRDEKTGLPVYSLYEKDQRKPTAEMLKGIDTLVYDIQDIGCRFYTYTATCGLAMEAAAENHIKFVVLDRPNPLNGNDIEGPVAEEELTRQKGYYFTSFHPIPVRYGMTIGELAMLFNAERKVGADVTVIKMSGWNRRDFYDMTLLTWVNPSPNMRSLTEAVLYPGIGLLETTNISVGRGTDTPFEVVGAPYIDGLKLAEQLNQAGLPGVRFVPVRFTPKSSKFVGEECGGVNIIVTDRNTFRSVVTGTEIAYQLRRLYTEVWKVDDYLRLLVNRDVLAALKGGRMTNEITLGWLKGLAEFNQTRQKYLLY